MENKKPKIELKLDKGFFKKYWIDALVFIGYLIGIIVAIQNMNRLRFLFFNSYFEQLYKPSYYATMMISICVLWVISTLGEISKKSYLRVRQFILLFGLLTLYGLTYFAQIVNMGFSYWFFNHPNIGLVPLSLITSFLRASSIFLPFVSMLPIILIMTFALFKEEARKEIRDFEIEAILPDVEPVGENTCEMEICIDQASGKKVICPEEKRQEHCLIVGATGTGKTATALIPMVAKDIYKKWFLRESLKKIAYKFLEEGKAYVACPVVSDEWFSSHFDMSMIEPYPKYQKEFDKAVKKFVYKKKVRKDYSTDKKVTKTIYKDLGFTVVEPSGDFALEVMGLCKKHDIDYYYIDPCSPESFFINPMLGDNPAKIANVISEVLKGMYESEGSGGGNVFFTQVTQSAIENCVILLKLIYPRLNEGKEPTLEDLLALLHNFDLAEELTVELMKDPVLSSKYRAVIGYFQQNFFKPETDNMGRAIVGSSRGSGRKETEKFLYGARTQLENLLRREELTRILCNRERSVNLQEVLEKGKVLVVCTRLGALGKLLSTAFGMFFILSFQDAVLNRPYEISPLLPHFLYIDEFPLYVNKETETCFTIFRKYRTSMIIAIQNLSQLAKTPAMAYYKQVVVNNTSTQLFFGRTNVEDSEYISLAFGTQKKMEMQSGYAQTSLSVENPTYSETYRATEKDVNRYSATDVNELEFKELLYKAPNRKGRITKGVGNVDFNKGKYDKAKPCKVYDFSKYINVEKAREYIKVQSIEESTAKANINNVIYNRTHAKVSGDSISTDFSIVDDVDSIDNTQNNSTNKAKPNVGVPMFDMSSIEVDTPKQNVKGNGDIVVQVDVDDTANLVEVKDNTDDVKVDVSMYVQKPTNVVINTNPAKFHIVDKEDFVVDLTSLGEQDTKLREEMYKNRPVEEKVTPASATEVAVASNNATVIAENTNNTSVDIISVEVPNTVLPQTQEKSKYKLADDSMVNVSVEEMEVKMAVSPDDEKGESLNNNGDIVIIIPEEESETPVFDAFEFTIIDKE